MNGGITPKKLNQSLVDNAATTNTCLWLEDSTESLPAANKLRAGQSKNTHKTIYNIRPCWVLLDRGFLEKNDNIIYFPIFYRK